MFYDNIYKLFSIERKEIICVKLDWLINICIVICKFFDMYLYNINSVSLFFIDFVFDKVKLWVEFKV